MINPIFWVEHEQTGPYTFNGASSPRSDIHYFTMTSGIEINKAVDELVQTASFKLPRRFTLNVFKSFPDKQPYEGRNISTNYRGIELNQGILTIYSDNGSFKGQSVKVDYNNLANSFVSNVDAVDLSDVVPGTPVLFTTPPLFQRGDMITIYLGYLIDLSIVSTDTKDITTPILLYQQFRGYISQISAGEEIEIHCEDFMWYLKQLRIPNIQYNSDPKDPSNLNKDGSLKGITSTCISDTIVTQNNYIYNWRSILDINPIINNTTPPSAYTRNVIPGIIMDCLNNASNLQGLANKGIFPLIWNMNNKNLPQPLISLGCQPIMNCADIRIENNSSFYGLLEKIKDQYNLNIYFLQQAPQYNMSIDEYNLPSHTLYSDQGSNSGYPGNYLNLGFNTYVPSQVYQPVVYNLYLNGQNANVISNNLVWRRVEDFLMCILVKGTNKNGIVYKDENTEEVLINSTAKKKKTTGHSLVVGDLGGSMNTEIYTSSCILTKGTTYLDGSLAPGKTKPLGGVIPKDSFMWNMASYGINKLNDIHYTGYYGTITIFGTPFINIGDIVSIHDTLYPERRGSYKVKKVNIKLDSNGIQQEITLHWQTMQDPNSNWIPIPQPSNSNIYYEGFQYTLGS